MKLRLAWYRTDATEDDPEYLGTFSAAIPDPELLRAQIVGVDWSSFGWVKVTYLEREL